jgi:hypothetical protein
MCVNNWGDYDDKRLQDPIFLLRVPIGSLKNFFKIYFKFYHALLKELTNLCLGTFNVQ